MVLGSPVQGMKYSQYFIPAALSIILVGSFYPLIRLLTRGIQINCRGYFYTSPLTSEVVDNIRQAVVEDWE